VEISRLAPKEFQGWVPGEPDRIYSADTLYDLIDGAAEVYRALNVQRVYSQRYVKAGAPDIYLDIFDMGSSRDAFGAFHHDMREDPTASIGQESEFSGANLSFWKGRYFVSIVPFDDSEPMRRAALGLGRHVASAIPEEGQPPELLGLLPAEGLLPGQLHYFHDERLLNLHLSLGAGNPLQLDASTQGILARYRVASGSGAPGTPPLAALLLVQYPSPERVQRVGARMDKPSPFPGTAGGASPWAGYRVLGLVLAAVLDATPEQALDLLDQVEARHGKR
jgi:hypothetical protein